MKKTMGSEIGDNNLIVTQISVGGLENYVTAKMLLDYFEDNIGLVWRCRLKTSSTPPESNPNYEIDAESVQRKTDYVKIEPHAFVHFAVAHSAKAALDAAAVVSLYWEGSL
ncbi:UNVERIFIED_CONTAM: RNA-dependent RNA polymerase 6 [Sesamum radiatum]|uniref:RNA-dependent RNA polymerase 6 n=1 Tax=Sesamum radiatum TaxID=300843 RepID=A0AAW2L0K6_SESRA